MSARDSGTTAHPDPEALGRAALERELYWAERSPDPDEIDATGLTTSWSALSERLRLQEATGGPHPFPDPGRWPRRFAKRVLFRVLRPVTRRSGQVESELAELGTKTARRLEDGLTSLEWSMGPLLAEMAALRAQRAARPGAGVAVPDEFYWRFETFMRGDPATVAANLKQYEGRARAHLLENEWLEPPLWLDLGCGRGEFGLLLQQWGWRVRGIDTSAEAVDACMAAGIDAIQGDAVAFLAGYAGEPLGAISGLQLIEHLPREVWLELIATAFEKLQPDGALLLETINPLNVRALAGSFFADLSHAWPAHPHTLRLMAETVGFSSVELLWMNPDEQGEAQDFALWAVK